MSTVKVIEDKQGEERQATPTLALEGSVKYENDPVRLILFLKREVSC